MQHVEHILNYLPPLFLYTIIFIGGITWQAYQANVWIIPILLAATVLCLLLKDYQKTRPLLIPWAIAAFSAGAFRHTLNEYYFLKEAEALCNKKSTITGTILAREATNKSWMSQLTIAIDSPAQPHIKVYCTQPVHGAPGDLITIENIYLKNTEHHKLTTYFKKQNIVATGYIGKQQKITCAPPQQNRFIDWFAKKRVWLAQRFTTILSPRTALLVNSIFLGYKAAKTVMQDDLYEQFQWWGISHYLARSGLHLVMFVIILHLLLMFFPIPLYSKHLLICCCIGVYTLLSWSSVSFIRSLLMIFCYLFCSTFKMQQHGLHTISLACCAILLYNPTFLFAIDFQLSFGLTLALILLHYVSRSR